MTRKELIDEVVNVTGETKVKTKAVIDATLDAIVNAIINGDKVALVGFGTFDITERAEREGRNPQTGESITIPATKSPKFKAAKAFKDAIKEA